jgi:hypothetical protein
MLKTSLKKKKRNNSNSSKPQQKSPQQTLTSEIINPTVLLCVLLAAKGKAHSVPDVTWACAWCLVTRNITQK